MWMWDNTKVTIELGTLVDSGIDIWAFTYPSYYTGMEKELFEQKVIDHYRFRQIGQETPGRWLHMFHTRMREIMPYYIQLYESEALMKSIEDPFSNVDVVETFEESRTGSRASTLSRETSANVSSESSSTSTGETSDTETANETTAAENTKKFSNTPQGDITNLDSHLTEATVDNGENTVTSEKTASGNSSAETTSGGTEVSSGTLADTASGSEEGTTRHTMTKKGNQGVNTFAHDMAELRKTFLNIDMQIIQELNDLFLGIY